MLGEFVMSCAAMGVFVHSQDEFSAEALRMGSPWNNTSCFCVAGGTTVLPPAAGFTAFGGWANTARADGKFSTTIDDVHVVFLRSNGTAQRPLMLTTDEAQAQAYVELANDALVNGNAASAEATYVWAEPIPVRWDVATCDAGFEDTQ